MSEKIGQLKMRATDGKMYKTNVANTDQLFCLIQSIPSPKAEPFKLWIAQVAKERLDQIQDPELSIEQAMMDYKHLAYSDNWINQRLKSIEIRKELTDEWKSRGLEEGVQFATLTDIIYKTWADKTAREYKQFKGLKKENLRDNMTNTELVLNMLAGILPIDILGELVSIGTLLAFEIVCVGIIFLRVKRPEIKRPFKTPLVPLVPTLGALICMIQMYSLPIDTWLRLIIWMAIGMLIYFTYSIRHSLLRNQNADKK